MKEELTSVIKDGEGECVEFKSEYKQGKLGKTISAFANTKGGKIYIGIHDEKANRPERVVGVEDPDSVISKVKNVANGCDPAVQIHVRRVFLDSNDVKKKAVVVVEVSERRSEHLHRYESKVYVRVGEEDKPVSSAELTSLMKERSSFDEDLCHEFKYEEHFDQEKALVVFKQSEPDDSKEKTTGLLVSAGAAVRKNGDIVFRNVGVLFFAKNLGDFYLHASIRCIYFSGLDEDGKIVAKKQFNEGLLSDIEKAMAFLREHLNTEYKFPNDKMQREEVLEVPQDALREAIVNAVTHRDYRERGADTIIKVFDNRVEISNPCIYKETDIKSVRDSRRINPIIADLMDRAGYVERAGRGLKKIQNLTSNIGQPITFSIKNYCWKIIFPRKEYGKKIFGDAQFNFGDKSLTSKRADRLVSILSLVANRKFSKNTFINEEGISNRTVEEDLKYLRQNELIIFEGTRQLGEYRITELYLHVGETGLSPFALKVAKVFVEKSEEGNEAEFPLSIEELEQSLHIGEEKLLDALYELDQHELVSLSLTAGHSHPTHASARSEMFVKLDRLWMSWNPEEDANVIFADMINKDGQEITPKQVAEQYGWSLRRVNPALHIIRKNSSHFALPNIHAGEFKPPEFARFAWHRGREAAEDFWHYAYSNTYKEDTRKEVILLMCLRSAVSYLTHTLYRDILRERTTVEGSHLGVYFASTPEKERKVKLIQYLQQLASDLEKEEAKYGKKK